MQPIMGVSMLGDDLFGRMGGRMGNRIDPMQSLLTEMMGRNRYMMGRPQF